MMWLGQVSLRVFLIISLLLAMVILIHYSQDNREQLINKGAQEYTQNTEANRIISLGDDIYPQKDIIAKEKCFENGITNRKCCLGACRQTQKMGAQFHPWTDTGVLSQYVSGGASGSDYGNTHSGIDGGGSTESLQELLVALQDAVGDKQECRIIYSGDSLMDDQRSAQICQMLQIGYTINHYEGLTKAQESVVRDDAHLHELLNATADDPLEPLSATFITLIRNSTGKIPIDEYHSLRHTSARNGPLGPCNSMQLIKLPPPDLVAYPSLHHLMQGSLVLLNWEVHCNSRQCMKDKIDELINPVVDIASEQGALAIIWRSAETQHFHTADGSGLYERLVDRDSCAEITVPSESRYRKDIIQQEFLDKHPNISVVPVGEWSLPEYWMHNPRDCTHYCYAPGRSTPVWQAIRDILQKTLNQV